MSIIETLFSFEGRIGRARFWAVYIPLLLIGLAGNVLITVNNEFAGPVLVLAIPLIWINIAIIVKRWHDLGLSGWMTFTLIIPLVNLLFLLYLGFAPGKKDTNKYGNGSIQLDISADARCPQCGVGEPGHADWCPSIYKKLKERVSQ